MSVTDPMTKRLTEDLEPVLALPDPRERISAYHDMPYALFRYSPEEEFELRKQVTLLKTRLSQKGKRVWRISLAECLDEAMRQQRPLEDWFTAEREQGVETIVETVHSVLSEYTPLVDQVAARMPDDPNPVRDIVFMCVRVPFSRVPDVLAPRTAEGSRARPDSVVLPGRTRWRRGTSLHGRARRRAQLPAEDLLMCRTFEDLS